MRTSASAFSAGEALDPSAELSSKTPDTAAAERQNNALPERAATENRVVGTTRTVVARGIASVAIASIVIRSGGLLAQVAAGFLLTSGDFGLFAATLILSTVSAALLSTLRPLFIQRLSRDEPVDALWRVILLTLVAAACIIFSLAEPIAHALGRPEAVNVIRLAAPTLPLQYAQVLNFAKLSASYRFEESSKILAYSAMARHCSLVIFAVAGLGVYALVLPLFVEAAVQINLLRRTVGHLPPLVGQISGVLNDHRATLGWLCASALGLALTISGDYAFISPLETAAVVGLYFFGYQLTTALTQPFTMAATSILVPAFASVTETPKKLQSTFLEAISLLLVVSCVAFGLFGVIAGTIIDLVWAGSWNLSATVVVIMALGTPFRILQPTCCSVLQATARWRRLAQVMTTGAFCAVVPAVTGAFVGGLQAISIGATIGAIAGGTLAAGVVGSTIGIAWTRTFTVLMRASAAPILGLAAAFLILPGYVSSIPVSAARAGIYSFAVLPTVIALHGDAIGSFGRLLRPSRA